MVGLTGAGGRSIASAHTLNALCVRIHMPAGASRRHGHPRSLRTRRWRPEEQQTSQQAIQCASVKVCRDSQRLNSRIRISRILWARANLSHCSSDLYTAL